MTSVLRELMLGKRPIRRTNPKSGQSEWYYMGPNGIEIDVENENSPNPYEAAIKNYWAQNDDYNYKLVYGNTPPSEQTLNSNVQQLRMPAGSEQQITMPKPQEPSTWNKFKNWVENTGTAMQAASVGYATGATLGNFDEAMGTATAAVTGNPSNYTMGRDATRKLQNDLQQRHPYIYGGSEVVGVTHANKYIPAYVMPVIAGIGYANNWGNTPINIIKI